MTENPSASDWASTRGEKWLAQLAGMEAMLAPVIEPLARALHLDRPCRIADIGCGGGGTTLELLRRAPHGSIVHGFDISPPLIESARRRTPPDARAIAFEVADMSIAAPPGGPYDRLVSRFGIMFFDDPASAFANIARWLAPGGRFAFAAWGPPAQNPWFSSVRQVVAEIVDMPFPDPEAPGPFRYADAAKLLALLAASGFAELQSNDWRGSLAVGGGLPAAEAAKFVLASLSLFSEVLAQAGDHAVQAAHDKLTARFSSNQQDGAVRFDSCVHIVTGIARA
jgi:SAM-dependent methyltransferase